MILETRSSPATRGTYVASDCRTARFRISNTSKVTAGTGATRASVATTRGSAPGARKSGRAIHALEKALTYTAPGNWLRAELQSQLIRAHQRYHRTPELEQRWKQFAAENPRDLGAYLQLIDLYERTGELDRQRDWLNELIVLAPKNSHYRLKLARVLAHQDDLEGASAVYDQLLKEQPGSVDLVFERARLDVQRDQTEAARARITALLATAPKDGSGARMCVGFFNCPG